jgi:hypothetical protein
MNENPPILEFDPNPDAFINPGDIAREIDGEIPELCIVSFFREVTAKLESEGKTRIIYQFETEASVVKLYELEHKGKKIAIFHPGVVLPWVHIYWKILLPMVARLLLHVEVAEKSIRS